MELLQVFDENKNMLNESIERDKKKEIEPGKYFMIILLFIENDEHKFLIQKTAESRFSEYATTGGHVTYGDNAIKTVIKEAKEELGLTLDEKEVKEIETLKGQYGYVSIYYCKKNIDINKLKKQEEEVESLQWMSIDEINELISENKFRKSHRIPFQKVLEKR